MQGTVGPTPTISVDIAAGDAALDRLDDATFVSDWEHLQSTCPWATTFQSFAFVDCWYRLHDALYEPIIVEGRDANGRLVGLMTLARRRTGRRIVGAGDIHAEYQGWIALEGASWPFLRGAVLGLERAYPRGRLSFTYLPPGTPVDQVGGSPWPDRFHVQPRSRGVMDLSDVTAIDASLRKGHNRNRMNGLRRSGDVTLETIATVDALAAEIDEIAVLCDLRQGAINDSLPFAANPLKRPLHLAMMERGLLRATILRVGPTMASAHLDVRNGDEELLSLIAHAPQFSKYSPGSLHVLLLARELADQGVARYDLSPGHGYKDRYATRHETIHRLSVQFGLADRIAADLSFRGIALATSALARTGRTPRSVQLELQQLRVRVTNKLTRRAKRVAAAMDATVLLLPSAANREAGESLSIDQLVDLLSYRPSSEAASRRTLLRLALHRLESGHRVLTRKESQVLAECWWLCRLDTPPGVSGRSGVNDASAAPTLLVYDPFVADRPLAGGRDMARRLSVTLQTLGPSTSVYAAVSLTQVDVIEWLVASGASRVGEIDVRTTSAAVRDEEDDPWLASVRRALAKARPSADAGGS